MFRCDTQKFFIDGTTENVGILEQQTSLFSWLKYNQHGSFSKDENLVQGGSTTMSFYLGKDTLSDMIIYCILFIDVKWLCLWTSYRNYKVGFLLPMTGMGTEERSPEQGYCFVQCIYNRKKKGSTDQ